MERSVQFLDSDDDDDCLHQEQAVVIFQSSIAKKLASSESRLPANFVGIRHVRPSHLTASSSANKKGNNNIVNNKGGLVPEVPAASPTIEFSVLQQNGTKRRMTKAEKKAKKRELEQERKETRQRRKVEQAAPLSVGFAETDENDVVEGDTKGDWTVGGDPKEQTPNSQLDNVPTALTSLLQEPSYHQMPLNKSAMEEEMEEGNKSELCPAILPPSMAFQFRSTVGHDCDDMDSGIIVYNHSLSQEWANDLHQKRVLPAEEIRSREDLRPLAYKLKPEPWRRLRPIIEQTVLPTAIRCRSDEAESNKQSSKEETIPVPKSRRWIGMTCRPPCQLTLERCNPILSQDQMLSIVFEYLYRETPYYVSCGAKFGSDFLIYDGPREKRHAFAGLRVLSPTGTSDKDSPLPLPTAYSLTSYVRCLNTSGKLALLATVQVSTLTPSQMDDDGWRPQYDIMFVDVALEKVLESLTHTSKRRRHGSQEQKRRDITKNLAK